MTNLEKLNEVIKETFGCEINKEYLAESGWVCNYINCEGHSCHGCVLEKPDDEEKFWNDEEKFWNAEYKPGSLSSIIPKDPRISYEEEKKWLEGKGGED